MPTIDPAETNGSVPQPGAVYYAPDHVEKRPVRWFVCFLLFAATTVNYMDRSVLSILAATLSRELHWSESSYSTIVAFFTAGYGIGYLMAGRVIDRLGTKVGYSIAIIVWALASMSHSLAYTVIGFGIARLALGIGESGNFPAAIKATTEWFPSEERGLATGIFNSGTNIAAFVTPFYVAWAVTTFHTWRAAFIATGTIGFLWLIVWWIFPYNKLRRSSSLTQERLALPAEKQSYLSLFKQRGTWAFAAGKFLTDPVWWLYLFWLPKFLQTRFNLDLKQVGWPLAIIYFGSAIGSIGGGYLSGFWMKRGKSINFGRKFAMATCAIFALPVLYAPHLTTITGAIIVFSIATAAHQGWSANLFSTPTDMFPSTSVSTVVGIGGAIGSVGGVIFQKFTGFMLDKTGSYEVPFLVAGSGYAISFLVMHLLVPRLGEARRA